MSKSNRSPIPEKWIASNDPKMEKFLSTMNSKLKKAGSIHRLNVIGDIKWAMKHLDDAREKHESQMRILESILGQMKKYGKSRPTKTKKNHS